jgi:hypothetical protein
MHLIELFLFRLDGVYSEFSFLFFTLQDFKQASPCIIMHGFGKSECTFSGKNLHFTMKSHVMQNYFDIF